MEIDIANDGRAFYIELDGRVQMWNPTTQATTTVGTVPVTLSHENGLLGIQLAENFDTTGHIYLAYSALPDASRAQPRLALHADRQHARPGADHLHLAAPAPGVLPHRRLARVGRQRRPLHLHGRQHQPVRARLQPDRRAARAARSGTPSARRATRTTRTARSCASGRSRTPPARRASGRRTRSRSGNMFPSPGTANRPCPRSTRWASGTRSGSTSTRRPAGS